MVVSIGDNCIDRYLAPLALERVGGNAVNVAATIATHGKSAAYAGVVGDDENGARILGALRNVGVNTECVTRAPGPTGLTEIRINGGDYAIVLEDYGVSDQVRVNDDLRRFLAAHATRIHLTVSGRALALVGELCPSPHPLSIDLGIVRNVNDLAPFKDTLACISEAFFSAGSEADDPTVHAALESALERGAEVAIATRGARGCTALLDGQSISVASQLTATEIVDPLGAGDAFIAGYLSTLRSGSQQSAATVEQSLRTASAWAAEACRRIGGWPGAEA